MRIAFVGKGGAGKSTLSAVTSLYISEQSNKPVMVFDADLNIHIPALLGFDDIPQEHHISHAAVAAELKQWLIHENSIKNLGAFRKTSPPTQKSNIIHVDNLENTPLYTYGKHRDNIHAFAVGTYQTDDIGASCYHNNLSIFENVLSHTNDRLGYVVADMVAGVDAFAGTLHAQFDITIFVVEPTKRSLEVWEKYQELAKDAGMDEQVFVVGNKVRNEKDAHFIATYVAPEKLLGHFYDDEHIRAVDQEATTLNLGSLQENNTSLLQDLYERINALPNNQQKRLEKLWALHKKYVSQAFVKERFGDLTGQIDTTFSFDHA